MASSKYETPIDMLPDEVLNMVFNRIHFHGHLRLSGVCKRWLNVVQNDALFMRTVKFDTWSMNETHTLMRSYRNVQLTGYYPNDNVIAENMQKLLKNVEIMSIGCITRDVLNCVMPLCENLKEVYTYGERPTHDTIKLSFKHPLPVKITPVESGITSEFLDRFNVITNILSWDFEEDTTDELIAKYGAVINSLIISLYRNGSAFQRLCRFENLSLQSLGILNLFDSDFDKDAAQAFLIKQAPFLKSIEIQGFTDDVMLGSICMLSNLETVKIHIVPYQNLCLNDLKALPKLVGLELTFLDGYQHYHQYDLDVAELTSLTNLHISSLSTSGDGTWLQICSLDKPIRALKTFTVSRVIIDLDSLEQIVQTMPGLKVLIIKDLVEKDFNEDEWLKVATQFNKLVHLEFLSESGFPNLLTNKCLNQLTLPALQCLGLYRDKETPVTRTTLNALGGNCPKLLRVYDTTNMEPTMFVRRLNKDQEFRRVRQIKKMDHGHRLSFDNDSVGSCSDDDGMEHPKCG